MSTNPKPETSPLISDLAHDEELRPELELFLTRLSARVESLRIHIAERDWPAASSVAQVLKGAASALGYPELSSCAGRIETLAAQKPEVQRADSLVSTVEDLEQLCQRARAAFTDGMAPAPAFSN